VLVGLQRRLIYFPFPAQVPPAEAVVAGAREVTLRTVDGYSTPKPAPITISDWQRGRQVYATTGTRLPRRSMT
jgi:hypothetical protein